MIDFLLSVPGKLKSISDYLTGTLYPYITTRTANLDTNVNSRAPASTALTNATWTDTRAGKLDLVVAEGPLTKAPTALSTPAFYYHPNPAVQAIYAYPGAGMFAPTTTSLVDVVNISGSGVLELCIAQGDSPNAGQGIQLVVTIDGTAIFNQTVTNTGGTYPVLVAAGLMAMHSFWNGTAVVYENVVSGLSHMPFKTSLRIQARKVAGNSGQVLYKYWRAT